MSPKYAYCRISTTDQNIDRQIIAVKQFAPDISDNNIFVDKKTGKDFEREQYQEMKVILEHISKASLKNEPIELIVEELDRLGRNADLIKKELMWFKEHIGTKKSYKTSNPESATGTSVYAIKFTCTQPSYYYSKYWNSPESTSVYGILFLNPTLPDDNTNILPPYAVEDGAYEFETILN